LWKGNALACAVEPDWGLKVTDEVKQSLIDLLLDNGADASCPNLNHDCPSHHEAPTALDLAIGAKKNELVRVFLHHGANFCSNSLRIAAGRGNEVAVKQIIASSTDLSEGGHM